MPDTAALRALDKRHLWHPFTQMKDWCASEEDPVILVEGRGATLIDSEGNGYLDGNSSIWTNIHGHGHPTITTALRDQLEKLAHCSALGFSNEPAIRLAQQLPALLPGSPLPRVFFSDDGSTAIECACKMAVQYRQLTGRSEKRRFLAFEDAYHGDTAGAASLGGIGVFFDRFGTTGYETVRLSSTGGLETLDPSTINAAVIEPVVRGPGGMKTWPRGLLSELRDWCDENDVLLIFDEVMVGFGRTGKMFAHQHEGAIPDFLCLAKGLTGGTLPLAATLTSDRIYEAFLGDYEELKTFFYGHSYCANPLGCAAALGSLQVFSEERVMESLPRKIERFSSELAVAFGDHPRIGDIRQAGLIAGIDLKDCDWRDQTGARVCRAARHHGLLTRPIRDTLTLLPPLCSTEEEIERMVAALREGLDDVVR